MIAVINAALIAMSAGAFLLFAGSLVQLRYPKSQKALGMLWAGAGLAWLVPAGVVVLAAIY